MLMETAHQPPWTTDLDALRAAAWETLLPQAISDRVDARLAILATIGAEGGPEARGVVIRAADPSRGTVDFFTDAATQKCDEIAHDPRVALTFWREDVLLQTRLTGAMSVVEGPLARAAWEGLPARALPDYGMTPAPGTPIDGPMAYDRRPDHARFAILRMSVARMDIVSLNRPSHTRALYDRRDGFRGHWVAP